MARFNPPYYEIQGIKKQPDIIELGSLYGICSSEEVDMQGYIDFDRPVKQLYNLVGISYDGVAETSNKNILAISLDNKVGLISILGDVILEPRYNIRNLKVWGNLIELYSSGGYNVFRIRFSRDLTKVTKKLIIVSTMNGSNNSWCTGFNTTRPQNHITNTMPKIVATTDNLILLHEDKESALITLVNKNGIVVSSGEYLNVVEVKYKKELLGIRPIYFGGTHMHRSVDILDVNGKVLKEKVTWGPEYVSKYHISESALYSRGLRAINKKGQVIT